MVQKCPVHGSSNDIRLISEKEHMAAVVTLVQGEQDAVGVIRSPVPVRVNDAHL